MSQESWSPSAFSGHCTEIIGRGQVQGKSNCSGVVEASVVGASHVGSEGLLREGEDHSRAQVT